MGSMRIMLDTNILVKFTFIYYKEDKNIKIPKSLRKFLSILTDFEFNKFRNVMTMWNRFELRDVLMRLKLAEKNFMSGFSIDEFRDAEEDIQLSKEELEGINLIITNFLIHSEWVNSTKEMDLEKIERLTKKDFSHMDIILLHQAELNNCDYFVTNDKKLWSNKELKEYFKVKVCNVNEFKDKLKQASNN
jgi:predicted nucleic-acid-binding protein